MKTTRTIVTTLLLVAAMLIGAVLVPATFAASEPVDDPVYATDNYDASVYTIPAGSVSHDYSLNVLVTEDVLSEVAIYGNNGHYVDTTEVVRQQITTIINNNYVYSHSVIQGPTEYDFVIADFNLMRDLYIQYVTNEIVVCDYSCGDCYVVTIGWEAMEEIMRIYRKNTSMTVELTNEIIENLKVMSKANPKLNVAGLDIALVERFIFGADLQAALEIVNILQANGHANDEYLQNALAADSWMDMSSSLMLEIISICEEHIYMVDYSAYGYLVGEVQDYYQHGQKPQAIVERAYYAMCVSVWMKSLNHVYSLE